MRILLFVLFLPFSALQAQPYTPMLGTTNEWRVVSCDNGCVTDAYYALGDTLVDGNNYRILDGYHYIAGNFLIREDVQERKVYMKTLVQHVLLDEYPLYDFSIQDGDTVDVYNPISPLPQYGGKFVLDSIVLRPLENGDHRFFYLHAVNPSVSLSERTVWVEGVGSLSLINSPGQAPTEGDHVVCAFKDGVLQYADLDSVYSCGALSVGQAPKQDVLTVYPNPASSMVYIKLPENSRATRTRVFDISGRLVHQQPFNPNLDVGHLDRGTYIIVVETEEGNFRATIQKE